MMDEVLFKIKNLKPAMFVKQKVCMHDHVQKKTVLGIPTCQYDPPLVDVHGVKCLLVPFPKWPSQFCVLQPKTLGLN